MKNYFIATLIFMAALPFAARAEESNKNLITDKGAAEAAIAVGSADLAYHSTRALLLSGQNKAASEKIKAELSEISHAQETFIKKNVPDILFQEYQTTINVEAGIGYPMPNDEEFKLKAARSKKAMNAAISSPEYQNLQRQYGEKLRELTGLNAKIKGGFSHSVPLNNVKTSTLKAVRGGAFVAAGAALYYYTTSNEGKIEGGQAQEFRAPDAPDEKRVVEDIATLGD
ncbi:MAG: hypothetical protein ACXWQO_05910 [Bdellovibrionota bacterium]